MLKGVPSIISPELMVVLMQMGHGDELVFADGNFPAAAHARRLVRADGHGVPELLEAVLQFLPLDAIVETPASVMQPVESNATEPAIWQDFRNLLDAAEDRPVRLEILERFAFYERAKQAFAIVATGETAIYANFIVKKGVVSSSPEA